MKTHQFSHFHLFLRTTPYYLNLLKVCITHYQGTVLYHASTLEFKPSASKILRAVARNGRVRELGMKRNDDPSSVLPPHSATPDKDKRKTANLTCGLAQ